SRRHSSAKSRSQKRRTRCHRGRCCGNPSTGASGFVFERVALIGVPGLLIRPAGPRRNTYHSRFYLLISPGWRSKFTPLGLPDSGLITATGRRGGCENPEHSKAELRARVMVVD